MPANKILFLLGFISLALSSCSQRFAIERQPERVMYVQEQKYISKGNIIGEECAYKQENIVPCGDIQSKRTAAVSVPIAGKRLSYHKKISIVNTLQVHEKQVCAKLKDASEEHSSRKALILRALFYALIAAILVVAFIKIAAISPSPLWLIPILFLIVVGFLITFFLCLVCMVSFFKAGKRKNLE